MLPPARPRSSQGSYRPLFTQSTVNTEHHNLNKSGKKQGKGEEMFDPIESDTESFYEKQQMHSTKRLRLSRTPGSNHRTLSTGKGPLSNVKQFKIPPLPLSYSSEAPHGSKEAPTEEDSDSQVPRRHFVQELVDAVGQNEQIFSPSEDEEATAAGTGQHPQPEAAVSDKHDTPSKSVSQLMRPPSRTSMTPFTDAALHHLEHSEKPQASDVDRSKISQPEQSTISTETATPDYLATTETERRQKEAKKQQEKRAPREKMAEDKGLTAEKEEQERLETEAANVQVERKESERKARELWKEKKAEEIRIAKEKAEQEALAKEEEAARLPEETAEIARLAEEKAETARLATKKAEADRKREEMRAAAEEKARQGKENAKAKAQRFKEVEEKKRRDRAAYLEGHQAADKLLADKRAEREKTRREEELAREGEKMMSAAEGARQLEAEKAKTPKSAPKTPKAPENRSSTPGTTKYPPRTDEQKIQRRQREAKKKAEETRKKQEESKRAWERAHFAADETVKDPANKLPSSATRLSSSAVGPALSSSPISSKSSAAPLRSSLKGSRANSALRRSASHIEAPPRESPDWTRSGGSAQTPITTYRATPPKSLRDINISLGPMHTIPLKPPRDVDSSKIPAGQKKPVQSRLSITVDRKMKGRIMDPPAAPKMGLVEELVVSSDNEDDSDSVSTWYSEDERNGICRSSKAGPSSKSKNRPAASDNRPLAEIPGSTAPLSSNIDPALRGEDTRMSEAHTAQSATPSTTASTSLPEKKSISRSPARQKSKTVSSSSGSGVEPEESDDSRSSSVEEVDSTVSKAGVESSGHLYISQESTQQSDNVSKVNGAKAQVPTMDGARSTLSQSSCEASAQPQRPMSPPSTNSTDIDEAVNAQIQSEIRASLSPAKPRKDPPAVREPDINKDAGAPEPTPHTNRLQVKKAVKPNKFRYPKLSEIMEAAREDLPRPGSHPESSSVRGAEEPKAFEMEDDLSSDSDDSKSDSDDDSGVTPSKSKQHSWVKSLTKRKFHAFSAE